MAPKYVPEEDGDMASYGLVPASLAMEHMLSTTLSRADAQDVLTCIDDELQDFGSRSPGRALQATSERVSAASVPPSFSEEMQAS